MNDRTRWTGPRDDYGRNRDDDGYRQQGGWGGSEGSYGGSRAGQYEQRSFGGGQQGGRYGNGQYDSHDNDYRGNEWRGTSDWGDPQPRQRGWSEHRDGDRLDRGYGAERSFGESGGRQQMDRGQDRDRDGASWSQRAWGGSSLREGDRGLDQRGPDRGLGGASRYGESYRSDRRDDYQRPGSQSFAAGYGMIDGPNYDERGPAGRERNWGGGSGAATPGYGRGYGPDYGREDSRGFLDRAGDQIAAWFGDDEAQARREQDARRDAAAQRESHRGRGPGDYTRSDERIREDANDRLTDDHHLDARRISVTVDKGEITLAGTVPDRHAKRRAEDLVEHISGVKHVQNNLRIEAQGGQGTSPWGSAQTGAGADTGQADASATGSTGLRGGATETGLSGGGRPDASAASPASGSAARSTAASTGTSGSAGTGSTGTGASGASATGVPTTGSSGSKSG